MSRSIRYTFILALVALGTCLAAVSGWRYARASAPVNGPIVLVSIEALRADRLPVYGYGRGSTPAIDGLAADGIVFERAYSHVPQTLPAHTTLLSGRLPFEHGVRDSVGFTVNANERLLAEMLHDRGYATAGVVSSFLLRKSTGIDQGFTLFDGVTAPTARTMPLQREGKESERVAERWFDSAGTTRAFLFLHLGDPAIQDGPLDESTLSERYDSAVSKADDSLGRLIRYLKAHQLYDQSTIIVVSDHGEGLGAHGERTHGAVLDEEALHIPLIIKQAAKNNAGVRVAAPVQQIDIVPTILDLAKAPIPGNLRGRSLAPMFDAGTHLDERMVYSESLFGHYHFGWAPLTSMTDGRYRLIRGASVELFDLDTDAGSNQNVAAAHPEVVARLKKALDDLMLDPHAAPMEAVAPADRERLESLGYVGIIEPTKTATNIPTDVTFVERYRDAVRLQAAGDLSASLDAFRALTISAPASADIWQHLAATATRAERHEIAADAYQHVANLLPERADGYLGAADALLRLRKPDDARARAQVVIDGPIGDATQQAAAHELLARVALGRRNYELARNEAATAEALDPRRPVSAYIAGRVALDQRRYVEALTQFETAVASVTSGTAAPIADLRIYTADALLRADRPAEAEYWFLEQLKDTPHSPRVISGLMTIYKSGDRTAEASALTAQH